MTTSPRFLIVDGYGFVFRAYHVQPPLSSPEGLPVGALYGFTSMMLKLLSELRPNNIIVVLDGGGKNLRHELYPAYKANRPPAPEDLRQQLPLIREAVASLGVHSIEYPGYEADDVIATLARSNREHKIPTTIISSDKDLMQLVDDDMIKMYDPLKNQMLTLGAIEEKLGVKASQVQDFLALVGDSSDNIPGVHGIGPKTAASLLAEFGTLHNLLENISSIKKARIAELLNTHKEDALLSWELAKLHDNVPIEQSPNASLWQKAGNNLIDYLHKYGFKSLIARAERVCDCTAADHSAKKSVEIKTSAKVADLTLLDSTSGQIISQILEQTKHSPVTLYYDTMQKILYLTADNVKIFGIKLLQEDVETTTGKQHELFAQAPITLTPNWQWLKELLADSTQRKITYNLKQLRYDLHNTTKEEFDYQAFEDLMLMDYALRCGVHSKNFQELLSHHIEGAVLPEGLSYAESIYDNLRKELITNKLYAIYRQIDLPISAILFEMEKIGFKLDIALLQKLSNEMSIKLSAIADKIYALAGEEFNIASPKQLAEILFTKLKLPTGKTNSKSNTISTGAETLEKLSEEGFEIADLLLGWRMLAKLKNTYTDALQTAANPVTDRVHSCFLQTSTNTSRLSSVEPNLQNIPIRTAEGNKIREAFISEPGTLLLSADYSQIELRILSEIADVTSLKEAFIQGIDIHKLTASQVFGINVEDVSQEMRRRAKAINFGIVYGISAFGLSKQLGISRKDAGAYIESYFAQYPGIKKYMEDTKNYAKDHGYVVNLFGRRTYTPLINNKNHSLRNFAERAAINAPIQATAADLAKLAMIETSARLKQEGFRTKMLLQVHDELVFESPLEEIDAVQKIIQHSMQGCAANYFTVPLKVDINKNINWAK